MNRSDPLSPVWLLMGPTASGKTALAVDIVQRLPCEIISVDSAQVYRGMDIGTAKPDAATLRKAPHRLIDILDPVETYSAGRFITDAQREITAIQASGRVPLLVGGTMLYFRALEKGLAELPSADPEIRRRLAEEFAKYGCTVLHRRLAQYDPQAAARIHPHDTQRIQRALEILELTGCSMTELCNRPRNESLSFRFFKLIVAPTERRVLHDCIAQRYKSMLAQGLIEEVARLKARGDLNLDKPAMRAVGYRQVWAYLDGLLDMDGLLERGIMATRQFAKRQLTWLRAESEAVWLDSHHPRLLDQAIAQVSSRRFFPNALDRLC